METSTIGGSFGGDFLPYGALTTSLLEGNLDLLVMCEASDGLVALEKAQQPGRFIFYFFVQGEVGYADPENLGGGVSARGNAPGPTCAAIYNVDPGRSG